jgi:hypothetical protein
MTPNERLGLHLWLTEEMGFVVSVKQRSLTTYSHLEYGFNIVVPDGIEIDTFDPNHVRTFTMNMMEQRREQTALNDVFAGLYS